MARIFPIGCTGPRSQSAWKISQIDAVMEQARRAGAVIVKQAHATFWGGYAGYFLDPDRHLWEVAWNPQMAPDD